MVVVVVGRMPVTGDGGDSDDDYGGNVRPAMVAGMMPILVIGDGGRGGCDSDMATDSCSDDAHDQ